MLKILTASSALALAFAMPATAADSSAAPAAPQTVKAKPAATPAQPAEPATPAKPATPAEPGTAAAEPAAPATPAAPAQAATPANPAADPARVAQVEKLVSAEFGNYDADKNGELSETEFASWVITLRDKAESAAANANAPKLDVAAKTQWAKQAFAQADADKSTKVSKTEMSTFLLG